MNCDGENVPKMKIPLEFAILNPHADGFLR
jgi:hypothetical protein